MADFADFIVLDLSGPQVRVFVPDGARWCLVAEVPIDTPDLAASLRGMRALETLQGVPAITLLPDSEVARVPPPREVGPSDETDPPLTAEAIDADGALIDLCVRRETAREADRFATALGLAPGGVAVRAHCEGALTPLGSAEAPVATARALPALPGPHAIPSDARLRAIAAARRLPPAPAMEAAGFDDDPSLAARRQAVAARLLRKAQGGAGLLSRPGLVRAGALVALLSAVVIGAALSVETWATGPAPRAGEPAAAPEADFAASPSPAPMSPPPPGDSRSDAASGAPAPELPATLFTPAPRLTDGAGPDDLASLVQPGIDATYRIDAFALPRPAVAGPANPPRGLAPPPAADAAPVVDARGLVVPIPEGRRAPGGYTVVAGPPDAVPPQRPVRTEADLPLVVVASRSDLAEDDPLRTLSPRERPASLVARNQRAQLGGKTRGELAHLDPPQRPASAQDAAGTDASPTAQAVALGPRPAARSAAAFAAFRTARAVPAQTTQAATTDTAAPATATVTPAVPTPAPVQSAAASRGRMDLSEVNLLGTFGSRAAPRALVRLPGGRVVNVSVGDRLDGGRVADIDSGRLDYIVGGRTRRLELPRL